MRKKIAWGVAASLFLLSLYLGHRWLITPRINPSPELKVIVHGQFPYDRGWDLQIKTSFYTKNPQCEVIARVFSLFPIASVAREVWVDIPVVREGGNNYSFFYYEDYFLSGYCQWEQRFVYSRKYLEGRWERGAISISGLDGKFNQINYECWYRDNLVPGLGENAREKIISCFDYLGKNNRFDPKILGKELNFFFNSKIQYEYYDAAGNRAIMWKEGDEK